MDNDEMTPELVNPDEWEQSGEGWNALTYYHRTDDRLLLKLNSESVPFEEALTEYKFTKAVNEMGVRSPAAIRLATDGKRFGFISERLVGKKSFTRMISENPEMLEPLAKDMAESARILHSLPCDTGRFESITERLRNEVNSCKWIKGELRETLNSYADSMHPVTTCLHGDMHPGNILRTDRGDFWIDMARFGYGDPDLDYASQYILANLAPESMTKWILHIDHKTYSRFVELYGQHYYGEEFHSPETQERLRRAVSLTLGHAMTKSPAAVWIFGSYVRGHEKVAFALVKLISLFVRK